MDQAVTAILAVYDVRARDDQEHMREVSLLAAGPYRRPVRAAPETSPVLVAVGGSIDVSRFRTDP
jgi:hypothetical protein